MTGSVGAKLDEFLREYGTVPFSWRRANCCHFVAAWMARVEKVDYLRMFEDAMPRNGPAAVRYCAKRGGLHVVVSSVLLRPMMNAMLAQVGDPILFLPNNHSVTGGAGTLAICNGRVSFARALDGSFELLETQDAAYAWRLDPYVDEDTGDEKA